MTWTTYIGKLYVCEGIAPPFSCAKMIFSGSQRIAIKQVGSGSTSYFHPDHLGSTSVLTDGNGVSEQDVTYYPYGDTRSNTGTADVPYKYTGKEQDGSTGPWSRFRSRYLPYKIYSVSPTSFFLSSSPDYRSPSSRKLGIMIQFLSNYLDGCTGAEGHRIVGAQSIQLYPK